MTPRIASAVIFAAILAAALPAFADRVVMKDGRVLDGKIEKEEPDRVLLRMNLGSVWLKRAEIESVEKEPDPKDEYERRSRAIPAADAAAWLELGRFCLSKDLITQAELCMRNALTADPGSAEARDSLDRILTARAVEAVAAAETVGEALDEWPRIVPLGARAKAAFSAALRGRAAKITLLSEDAQGIGAWLSAELRTHRQRLLAIVMNERLYDDRAEASRKKVASMVQRLNVIFDGPHGAGFVESHPAAGRIIGEASRIGAVCGLFDDPDLSAPAVFEAAVEGLSKTLERCAAELLNTRLDEANRLCSESNSEAAKKAGLSADEAGGLAAINEYRGRLGLRSLRFDTSLFAAAKDHSTAMARQGFFSHESPLAGLKTPYARIRKAGYDWRIAGENIAKCEGGLTPRSALEAWIDSPGHHRNLVRPEFEDAGLGVEGELWTLDLGARKKD